MSLGLCKNVLSGCSQFLNKPQNKQNFKNLMGVCTFSFGLVEILDKMKWLQPPEEKTPEEKTPEKKKITSENKYLQALRKACLIHSKVSLILSGAVTPVGVAVISKVASFIFTSAQWEKLFGPNTICAINPRHPRHVVSFVAVAFALPTLLLDGAQFIYTVCKGRNGLISGTESTKKAFDGRIFTDEIIKRMALFNFITSRPVLHMGNQLVSYLIKRN